MIETNIKSSQVHLYGYVVIPAELCQYALSKKLTRQLGIYVTLKMLYGGIVHKDRIDYAQVAYKLGMKCERSVKNCMRRLVEMNWIGFNTLTGNYFIRGFGELMSQLGFSRLRGIPIGLEAVIEIKSVCFACLTTKLINVQKLKILKGRGSANLKGVALQLLLPLHFPIAVRAFSKILNLSVSTVHQLLKKSVNAGYINVKENLTILDLSGQYGNIIRRKNEYIRERVRYRNRRFVFVKPFLISSNVKLKKVKRWNRRWKNSE